MDNDDTMAIEEERMMRVQRGAKGLVVTTACPQEQEAVLAETLNRALAEHVPEPGFHEQVALGWFSMRNGSVAACPNTYGDDFDAATYMVALKALSRTMPGREFKVGFEPIVFEFLSLRDGSFGCDDPEVDAFLRESFGDR